MSICGICACVRVCMCVWGGGGGLWCRTCMQPLGVSVGRVLVCLRVLFCVAVCCVLCCLRVLLCVCVLCSCVLCLRLLCCVFVCCLCVVLCVRVLRLCVFEIVPYHGYSALYRVLAIL